MHRRPLLDLLDRYAATYPEETPCVDTIRELVLGHRNCFERTCLPGHITGSAWILSPDHRFVLLTHHRKLDRWLQLGGHADGQFDVRDVALREAREESGLDGFTTMPEFPANDAFDIDVHLIPARGSEPAHWHHDIRFLLVAPADRQLRISNESKDLRWVARDELSLYTHETSIRRMEAKTRAILSAAQRR